jgi:hypothetical protein
MQQTLPGAVGNHLLAQMAENFPIHSFDFEAGLIRDEPARMKTCRSLSPDR